MKDLLRTTIVKVTDFIFVSEGARLPIHYQHPYRNENKESRLGFGTLTRISSLFLSVVLIVSCFYDVDLRGKLETERVFMRTVLTRGAVR